MRLCKWGYADSLDKAREMNARDVLQCLAFEHFLADYESAYMEINKRGT